MTTAVNFDAAAHALIDLVGRIRPDQWDDPGLGVWNVRSLAGHAGRAILTVELYLDKPAPDIADLPDAESYYVSVVSDGMDHYAVADRGVAAGMELGDHPAGSLSKALVRALGRLAAEPDRRNVAVVGGRSIRIDEYLRTRVFELVVHTMDLSRATGIRHDLPPHALEDAAALAARVAARQGVGEALLLAMTGRIGLPDGFSVV